MGLVHGTAFHKSSMTNGHEVRLWGNIENKSMKSIPLTLINAISKTSLLEELLHGDHGSGRRGCYPFCRSCKGDAVLNSRWKHWILSQSPLSRGFGTHDRFYRSLKKKSLLTAVKCGRVVFWTEAMQRRPSYGHHPHYSSFKRFRSCTPVQEAFFCNHAKSRTIT